MTAPARGIQRMPTPNERIRHDTYGEPYPDPLDLLVELVTARSGAGTVAISDRDIAQRLRLRSTDDALRLVAMAVSAGRVTEARDGDRRRLGIPHAVFRQETAPRALVEQVRAALPPPPPEPRAVPARPAPFVPRPTREIGPSVTSQPVAPVAVPDASPALPPPTPPEIPAKTEETTMPATTPQPAPKKHVVSVSVLAEDHALFAALAEGRGVPVARVVTDAALSWLHRGAPASEAVAAPADTATPETAAAPVTLLEVSAQAEVALSDLLGSVVTLGTRTFVFARQEQDR